jgi:hypothetical protein
MVNLLHGVQTKYGWTPQDPLLPREALSDLRSASRDIGSLELRDYEQILETLDGLITADKSLAATVAWYESRPTVSPWEVKMEADRRIALDKRRRDGLPVDDSYQPKWLSRALKEYEKATP